VLLTVLPAMRISIVIPALNEAACIAAILLLLQALRMSINTKEGLFISNITSFILMP
jgi:hypothetical protein